MDGSGDNLREDVYRAIALTGLSGMTCDEVERETGLSHQSASARIRELALMNRIFDSGARRVTRSGRRATVWLADARPHPSGVTS